MGYPARSCARKKSAALRDAVRRELGAEPLAKPGEIGRGRGRDRVDNIKSKGGDDPAYKLARLQRDKNT